MVWRKAWERSWNEVRFCSDKCRADSKRAAKGVQGKGDMPSGSGAGDKSPKGDRCGHEIEQARSGKEKCDGLTTQPEGRCDVID